MSISDILKEEGCHLTAEGVETLGLPETTTDPKVLLKKVLDLDLREIGAPAFPEEFCKSGTKCESLEEPVFVQIQKVRNISAPKANEESKHAPRMLKLILTDGHVTCQAIEVEHISSLSINTPPGTKIQLKSGPLTTAHGFLFVGPSSLKVLGGHVTHMVEKWELNRSLAKHTRGGGGDGAPPPWIPFGQPLDGRDLSDMGFKSLQDPAKLDNVEFEAQRKGAIAEAQKLSGIKKVFGGGTKPMLDTNVQKIVDAGFSEEQAENTLKITKNNADRALKMLQKREGSVEAKKERPSKQVSDAPKGRKGRFKDSEEEAAAPVKPSGKLSLFDFLEDKLPAIPEPEKPAKSTEPSQYLKEDSRPERNNTDRRGGHSAKGGGRGGQRGAISRLNNYNNRNDYQQSQNHSFNHNETPRNYNHQREDRPHSSYNHQVPNERAPRFQKKFEGDARRQQQQQQQQLQQNMNMTQETSYPSNYQQQHHQVQPNYYDRRSVTDSRGPRNMFTQPQQTMEALADSTANMNIEPQIKYNNRSNVPQNYQNNYGYQHKSNYNNQNMFNDQSYKRNTQYVNNNKNNMPNLANVPNGIPMGQFYSSYPDSQPKMGQNHSRQPDVMELFRQQQATPVADQRNNFTVRGNGFYQANNIVGFQNASINEQARKMLAEGSEINWNTGDRCLAKYWEDNGFYDAEITGVSTRTVVVRFLAYGNHEEVLKTDCLPPNTPVNRPFAGEGAMSRSEHRPGRFQQPMYVPPAQRKA